jgi:hypothetical protein
MCPRHACIVASHIEDRLLQPSRLEEVLASILDWRRERAERRQELSAS